MSNSKKVTVDQLNTVAQGIATKSDARFRKSADKLAKTDLADTLKNEIEGKANTSDLGTLSGKSSVTEEELGDALKQKVNGKANSTDVYAKTETYTKNEVDDAIAAAATSAYKAAGSLEATGIVSSLLVAANEGKVYNVSGAFTTTADFVEGAGKGHPAGTNIVVVNSGTSEAPAYKFDVLAGFVDLSDYAHNSDVEVATAQDIQDIVDGLYTD